MKKIIGSILIFTLVITVAGCASNKAPSNLSFDFEKDDGGFEVIYADYPNDEGVEDLYQFNHEHKEVPITDAGKGLFISSNNHSDDLFMGYYKKIDNLKKGENYYISVSFKLATNVDSGLMGVGGSPGDSVWIKGGVSNIKPAISIDNINHYRLNIDAGNQIQGGKDLAFLGTIAKQNEGNFGEYEFNAYSFETSVVANDNGEIYLVIASDSGFEAITSYYLDDIVINISSQ